MTAYSPLKWPVTVPRTQWPESSRFAVTVYAAVDDLYNELRLMGASDIQLTSNGKVGKSGALLSEQSRVQDVGVAVYFVREGKNLCIPCDKWNRLEDNIRAIAKTINALRGLERWGTRQMVDAAFEGFAALPTGRQWWEVLGVPEDAQPALIRARFHKLSREVHPDLGGDVEEWHRIRTAYDQAISR